MGRTLEAVGKLLLLILAALGVALGLDGLLGDDDQENPGDDPDGGGDPVDLAEQVEKMRREVRRQVEGELDTLSAELSAQVNDALESGAADLQAERDKLTDLMGRLEDAGPDGSDDGAGDEPAEPED